MTEALKEKILAFHLPAYPEIPDVGLFLEQTVKFTNGYLEVLGSISLTGSMVSNYVKKRLLRNPVRKQYDRGQIAQVVFIAVMKTVLSLEDVQTLLTLYRSLTDTRAAYEYFCAEFEGTLRYVFGLSAELAPLGGEHIEEKRLLRSAVMAVAYKIYLDESIAALRESSAN